MAVNNLNKTFHVQDSLDNFLVVVSKESKGRLLIFTIHLFNIMNSCSYKYVKRVIETQRPLKLTKKTKKTKRFS